MKDTRCLPDFQAYLPVAHGIGRKLRNRRRGIEGGLLGSLGNRPVNSGQGHLPRSLVGCGPRDLVGNRSGCAPYSSPCCPAGCSPGCSTSGSARCPASRSPRCSPHRPASYTPRSRVGHLPGCSDNRCPDGLTCHPTSCCPDWACPDLTWPEPVLHLAERGCPGWEPWSRLTPSNIYDAGILRPRRRFSPALRGTGGHAAVPR
jgi:hypothetical protein